jgi:hypothetical protein
VKRDLLLLAAWFAILLLKPPLYPLLAVSIPLVIAWGVVTLHFPSKVLIDDHHI